jgi:mannose-6-phosphate isomerase-like protein (cupin superfamily)
VTPPVDLVAAAGSLVRHWSPEIVARLNDYEVKVARLAGEFVRHRHAETDELFLVLSGTLTIRMDDGDVTLHAGQLYVVPRGVEHQPVTDGEVQVVLIEPTGVVNTGDR